jgi:hypothetical protein
MLRGDPQRPQLSASALRLTRPALVPKMNLATFCERFNLSDFILQKLDTMQITGPHGLRFVSNQQLVEAGNMGIGELADVRDAQERWSLGGENAGA